MEEAKNKIRDKIRNLTARMSRSNSASPSSSSTSQQQQKVFASAGVIKRSQDHPEVTRVMQALPPCAAQPETLYVSKEKVVVKEVPKLSTCVPVGDRDDISDAMSYGLHCKNHKHGRVINRFLTYTWEWSLQGCGNISNAAIHYMMYCRTPGPPVWPHFGNIDLLTLITFHI